jgi:hypothetical protein
VHDLTWHCRLLGLSFTAIPPSVLTSRSRVRLIVRYPDAGLPVIFARVIGCYESGHGFINDHDPADITVLLIVLTKLSGTRHHEPSASDAHQRIAAFFHRHLAT